jgi:hypothetical protein
LYWKKARGIKRPPQPPDQKDDRQQRLADHLPHLQPPIKLEDSSTSADEDGQAVKPRATPGRLGRRRQGLIRGLRIAGHGRVFSGEKRHPQPNLFLIVFNDSLNQVQELLDSWTGFLLSNFLAERPH